MPACCAPQGGEPCSLALEWTAEGQAGTSHVYCAVYVTLGLLLLIVY